MVKEEIMPFSFLKHALNRQATGSQLLLLIQTHHIRSVSNNQDPWPIEQSTVVFPMAPLQLKENEGTPW